MTPISRQYLPNELKLGSIKGRKVIADFSGGIITSDAGIILLAELDKKLRIKAKFAIGFSRLSRLILCRLFSTSIIGTKSLWDCFRLRRC